MPVALAQTSTPSVGVILLVAALAVVEIGLLIWALVDLVKRPATQLLGGSKVLWILVCLFAQIIGPILYLAIGRRADVEPLTAEEARRALPPPPVDARALAQAAQGGVPAPSGFAAPSRPPDGERGRVARAAAALYPGAPGENAGASDFGRTPASAVELLELRKLFKGNVALDGLTLRVPEGSVFGFLGPNGAGKTTTLRILAGLASPTSGSARVLGHTAGADAATRVLIGYLPDVPAFYKWMTAAEYLRFAGRLFDLTGPALEAQVSSLLELADLDRVTVRIGGFSRGMKQRLGIAQALVNSPRLLLLDEPTSALDPIGRREVLDMVAALRGRTTVFFSTHILADVERVCDTVAIIDRGRVVRQAPITELRGHRPGGNRLIVDVDDPPRLAAALAGQPWLRSVSAAESGGVLLDVTDLDTAQRALPFVVAQTGLALRRLESDELSLEDIFVDLIEERDA